MVSKCESVSSNPSCWSASEISEIQAAARAGEIGERRHHPNRRSVKGQKAGPRDSIARGVAQHRLAGELVLGSIDPLHLPHLFDHEAQADFDQAAIEAGAAQARRQHHVAHLAHQSARQCGRRAHHPLGQ